MNRTFVLKGSAAALLAVAVGLGGQAGAAYADAPAPNRRQALFEINFIIDTIDHHFAALQMGELCVDRATPPPPASDTTLRSTCEQIVAAQAVEIAHLRAWLQDWYGNDHQPMIPPSSRQMLEMLRAVDGEKFDIEVSEGFMHHHWTFLPDADRCAQAAYHDELRDMCDEMHDTQRNEVETFKMILNEHGEHRAGPNGNPGGHR